MLLKNKTTSRDGVITVQKTYDFTPVEQEVRQFRDADALGGKENRFVGRIPAPLLNEWIKEAGLRWDDRQAVQDMIRKKLLSGEFDTLRPWTGTF